MPEEKVPTIIQSAHNPVQPIKFVVVGAGGTGGRLIPPLMQVVRRIDSVAIVDGDHVEDRNLARQNFRTRDVGVNKAEVMVQRYRREGIQMNAYGAMLNEKNYKEIFQGVERFVILGCVDNSKARRQMQAIMNQYSAIWIDGGNETRGGQVIISAHGWNFDVKGVGKGGWTIKGMQAMPQLLVQRKEEEIEASCADRLDLQTVAVNQLSATCILNAVATILYSVPFSSCGAFFSTLNTMAPIGIKTASINTMEVLPETTYAAEA